MGKCGRRERMRRREKRRGEEEKRVLVKGKIEDEEGIKEEKKRGDLRRRQ